MAGRPRIFDETTAIKKAVEVFWKKGYEVTSTVDLIQAMGIQRGSFYNTFGSKKELFIKAIDIHEQSSFIEFRKILKESEDPIEILKMIFVSMADCSEDEYLKGCFAGNTLAALTGIDEELALIASVHLKEMESIFYDVIDNAKAIGRLKTKVETDLLAKYLLNLWNGLNLTRRIYHDKKTLIPLIKLQLEILA